MNKKLMKKINIFIIAFMLVITLVLSSVYAIEAKGETPSGNFTVTISGENVEDGHEYEAYQIFKGDLFLEDQTQEDGTSKKVPILSNVEWGSGIDGDKLITALKEDKIFNITDDDENSKNIFSECISASQVAKIVDTFEDDSELAKAFASHVGANLKSGEIVVSSKYDSESKKYTIEISDAGYYLIKDKDDTLNDKYDAYTRYILKVVNSTEVKPKSEKPSIKKSLSPDSDLKVDDHAINESFKFYLTATLPKSKEYAEYKKYKLVFTDTMSTGITFENIESVVVMEDSGKTYTIVEEKEGKVQSEDDCKYVFEQNAENNSFTLTIDDLKKAKDVDLTKGVKVVVTYNAHLNQNAVAVTNANKENNYNEVILNYSNNPNWTGDNDTEESTGKTPSDKNFVFTYEVDNTKYANEVDSEKVLKGAGFTLYKTSVENSNIVKLIWDSSISAYRPATNEEIESNKDTEKKWEITSQSDGKFNIKGLDEGTYILKETTTPGGYDTCKDIKIVISTTLTQSEDKQSATVTFDEDTEHMINDVINVHGVDLPSTGARTLVIICGVSVAFVIISIILSKKEKED